MISIDEALIIIEKEYKLLNSERMNIVSCVNRVLAEDIFSNQASYIKVV